MSVMTVRRLWPTVSVRLTPVVVFVLLATPLLSRTTPASDVSIPITTLPNKAKRQYLLTMYTMYCLLALRCYNGVRSMTLRSKVNGAKSKFTGSPVHTHLALHETAIHFSSTDMFDSF